MPLTRRPPKEDPITVEELAKYDGSDSSKPVYVAVKGGLGLLQTNPRYRLRCLATA